MTDTRMAIISIIVEASEATAELNNLLHEFGCYIIGRMGLPYREKGINVICVVVDAPQTIISNISGKIGRLSGITAKTLYTKA